jgi:predicted nucleic acid-binding protein
MKPRVYIETTVVSYLVARGSRDVVQVAHLEITRQWWETRRGDFDVYVSQVVVREAGQGDPDAAARRLAAIEALPRLALTVEVEALAGALVAEGPLPEKAADDAVHLALATVHEMDYLLTWNCTHLANAEMMAGVRRLLEGKGHTPPIVCLPEELLGEQ